MSEKIAEVVDGFEQMNARQQTIHKWLVTSWRNDSTTAHMVNLLGPACTCEDYQFNCDDGEACAHILKANNQAQATMDVGEALNYRLLDRLNDLGEAVDVIERRAAGVAADDAHDAAETADDDGSGDDDAGAGETDGVVREGVDATDDEQAARDELQSWFNQAAGFNGFDGEIVDLTVTEIAGHAEYLADERVIQVERQPFSGGYYDDGEWQDKETFDEHKEACGDSILSPRDEFSWFGEPDYVYVIPVDSVEELVD